jgi:hypothetical protein
MGTNDIIDYNREPRLRDVLEDPLIQAVMQRYGVDRETIEALAVTLEAQRADEPR